MKNATLLVAMMMTLLWLNTKINDKKGNEKSYPVEEIIVATAELPEGIKMQNPVSRIFEASFPGDDAIINGTITSNKQKKMQPGLEYNPVI